MNLIGPQGLAILTVIFFLALRFAPRAWLTEFDIPSGGLGFITTRTKKDIRFILSIVFSIVLGGAAFFYLFSPTYAGEDKEWAAGIIGGLFGHWVKE